MKVEVKLDRHRVNFREPGKLYLMVSLEAPQIEEVCRRPIDVVIVLDQSGSMSDPATDAAGSPSKLMLVKEAALALIEQLTSKDRVSVITYSRYVDVVANIAELSSAHRAHISGAVSRIQADGGTDLASGVLRGVEMLQNLSNNNQRTRRVMLFTDGLPTVGLTRHVDVMCAVTGKLRFGHAPISTFGFGAKVVMNGEGCGGYDPELLTSIARASGGNPYHAEGVDGILASFALELGALRSVAATDVRVAVTPGNVIVVARALNDFPTSTDSEATVMTLGNMYGEEKQHLVFELDVPAVGQPFPRKTLAATVNASGFVVNGGPFAKTARAEFTYVRLGEADIRPDSEVEAQRLRLEAAHKIKDAFARAAKGDFRGAVALITPLREAAARLCNNEGNELAAILIAIEQDLMNNERFNGSSGSINAASQCLGSGRDTGSSHTGKLGRSIVQDRALRDMKRRGH